MGKEERRFPRVAAAMPLTLKDGHRTIDLVTSDVSRHGAFLRTDSPKPLRQLVQLQFNLPNDRTVEVMGMVARCVTPAEAGRKGPGMGVDFFAMSKSARDVWEVFVQTLVKNGVPEELRPPEPESGPKEEPQPTKKLKSEDKDSLKEASKKSKKKPKKKPTKESKKEPPKAKKRKRKKPLVEDDDAPLGADPAGLEDLFSEVPDGASLEDSGGTPPPLPPPSTKRPKTEPPVRRQQMRFVASFMVRMKDTQRLRDFYTKDIGSGGMFLKTPLLKEEGDDVQLVLVHPETDQEYRLAGKVAHVVSGPKLSDRGLGIEFHARNENEENAMLEFIETGAEYLEPPPDERESTITGLKAAVEVAPDSAKAHVALGNVLLDEDEDLDRAVEEFEAALKLDEDYLPAHQGLQKTYALLGDTMKAFTHLKEVKRLEREGWSEEDAAD